MWNSNHNFPLDNGKPVLYRSYSLNGRPAVDIFNVKYRETWAKVDTDEEADKAWIDRVMRIIKGHIFGEVSEDGYKLISRKDSQVGDDMLQVVYFRVPDIATGPVQDSISKYEKALSYVSEEVKNDAFPILFLKSEKITTLPPLPSCWIVLAKPTVGVSTPYAYRRLDEIGDYPHPDVESQVAAIRAGDLAGVIAAMGNVLEEVAAPEVPAIGQIEDYLRQNGAMAAMMSGSGSTVFGIFSEKEDAQKACDGLELNGLAKDVFLTVPFQGQEEHA